jgi:hypothetical protein
MALKKVLIENASASQLADFAENTLGLEGVDYRLGTDKILAKMRTVLYDKDYIEIDVPESDIQRIDPPQAQGKRRMATVFIHNQDKPGGTEPVPTAVNGKQLFTPRNSQQTIPWEHYHVLDNAKHFVYQQGPNGELLTETRTEAHEYPFSLIREDPPLPTEKAA